MRKLVCYIMLVLHISIPSLASNEVGNGSDHELESKESAWFLEPRGRANKAAEPRIIRYCYAWDENFGASPQVVEKSLAQAFEIWADYIRRKRINDLRRWHIVTRGQLQKKCDGLEDLKFHFGVTSSEIEEQKRKYTNPTAFVFQKTYDVRAGWGRGIVWLAPTRSVRPEKEFPNWNQNGQLTAFLLHELGHVFGCSHIHGTIMDPNLSVLIENKMYPETHWTRIEYFREMVRERRDTTIYEGNLGSPGASDEENIFQFLFGRAPVGSVLTSLSYDRFGATLIIIDDRETARFPLIFDGFRHDLNQGRQVAFRSLYWFPQSDKNYQEGIVVGAEIQGGFLFDMKGHRVQVALEMGTEPPISVLQTWPVLGPVNIKFQDLSGSKYLFTSSPL